MVHVDSIQWLLEVEKRDIAYIVSIFEAYDNLAIVRTVNAEQSIIELIISPDYLEDTRQLVNALSDELCIKIIKPAQTTKLTDI
jgi:Mg/Co/Ni transporter MgtE